MKITHQEFNELVYWSCQAYIENQKKFSKHALATNEMLNDYIATISKAKLEGSMTKKQTLVNEKLINGINFNLYKNSILLNGGFLAQDQNYEQAISDICNNTFKTNYQYEPTNRPHLATHFLKVHGKTLGASLASLLLISALAPSIIPVGLGALAGAVIALLPMLLSNQNPNSDGLAETIQLMGYATLIGLLTVVGLIINPGMIYPVLIGAAAAASSAIITERATYCGTKFFNLPKLSPTETAPNASADLQIDSSTMTK